MCKEKPRLAMASKTQLLLYLLVAFFFFFPCLLLVMLEKEAWGQPLGSCLGFWLSYAGADAWGVSLVLGVASLLVSSMLVREEGLEIIGNPSTAPPGGLGADVDERRAFLPAKVGSGAPRAPWPSWPLAVSLQGVPDKGLGLLPEQCWRR